MAGVRAKFHCSSGTESEYKQKSYQFHAVYEENGVNKAWAKATPGGNLSITIDNPDAQIFEPGKDYFLDFSPSV